jgi:hypothetical protein
MLAVRLRAKGGPLVLTCSHASARDRAASSIARALAGTP